MTAQHDDTAIRGEIERALWRWSEWRADQRGVDEVMTLVDQWVWNVRRETSTDAAVPEPEPSRERAAQAAAEILACARNEANHLVQTAREQAATLYQTSVRPFGDLVQVSMAGSSTTAYRDARGTLWVQLDPGPRLMGDAERICTSCRIPKRLLQFRADKRGQEGRRSQCRDCENDKRRARRARSKKSR